MAAAETEGVRGVLGVVGGREDEVERQLELAGHESSLSSIEVRADLCESHEAALAIVRKVQSRFAVLFTLRTKAQGGAYSGDESARLGTFEAALKAGAAAVDAEWGTQVATRLAVAGRPVVISHHDFNGMMGVGEIARLTREASALRPVALKFVPTAQQPLDSVRMLEWVGAAERGDPQRVGFAMGPYGVASRILAVAAGAPWTYGSITQSVAPGQVSMREMLRLYRAHELAKDVQVLGVVGRPVGHSLSPHMHNPALQARDLNYVYLPLELRELADINDLVTPLRVRGVSVTIPFKEDAFRLATELDDASRAAGATNTLVFAPHAIAPHHGAKVAPNESAVAMQARGFNTDARGVVDPLLRRGVALKTCSVAIIGNGGAARGAVGALKAYGASCTIYARNPERGATVARDLGVTARPLEELRGQPHDHDLLVNATPLGLNAGDPSPVPRAAFNEHVIAFDMIYGSARTPFLEAAEAGGATELITGREMLICQGIAQFQYFTGERASYEEFEAGFDAGQANRSRA